MKKYDPQKTWNAEKEKATQKLEFLKEMINWCDAFIKHWDKLLRSNRDISDERICGNIQACRETKDRCETEITQIKWIYLDVNHPFVEESKK